MKTIFAESVEGRRAPGLALPVDDDAPRAAQMLPEALLRKSAPRLPQCSELDVVRHFTNLSKLNYSVDANFYPLGSCTMKYNPKFTEYVAALPGFARMHPLLAQLSGELAQGALQCLYDAERWLCEVTGMKAFTFQPMAGANGEYTGVKLIAAYHKAKGRNRTKMLIPDSAHGTNPASAVLAGFEIVNVPSRDGMVDPAALEEAMAKYPDQVAGLMMTNPNTLGLLELHLPRIVEVLRREDALLYNDAANQTAIDISLCKQLRCTCRTYAAAVLDTNCFCGCLVVNFTDACTDCCANLFCLLGSCYLTGTNCPDRLVCDNSSLCLLCSYVLESDLDLLTNPIQSDALLSLSQRLTTADDRGQTMFKCLQDFLVYGLIGLCKVFSSLRMSDDYVLNACICQHVRGDFSGVSTLFLEVHILSTHLNVCALASLYNRDNVDCRNAENNINFLIGYQRLQCLYQCYCFTGSHIHLPVSGNNLFSHCLFSIS